MKSKRLLRPLFAQRFLKAIVSMRQRRGSRSTFFERAGRIKLAADISMASAATACNRKQAWSVAVLKRSQAISQAGKLGIQRRQMAVSVSKRERRSLSRPEVLRRLVPGGDRMRLCCLFEEGADYIRALSAQVQVMQFIAESVCP